MNQEMSEFVMNTTESSSVTVTIAIGIYAFTQYDLRFLSYVR